MKGHIRLIIILAVFLTGVPFIALLADRQSAEPASGEAQDSVLMLFGDSTEPTLIPMREYIIGAVAAQMPAEFGEEALKAQAVLARTYALRRRAEEQLSPTPGLRGADFSDDSTSYNAYFTDEQLRKLYGKNTDEVKAKLSAAADYALTRTLTFEGKPIIAAFHAVSCGKTESALSAWGENIPYLTGVDSSEDLKSEVCESVLTMPSEKLYAALTAAFPDAKLSKSELSVKVTERTEAGCAATVELCGRSYVTGTAFAEAADLPSACFEVSEKDGTYIFTCKGRGHLVGLSQYGAEAMSKAGKSCEEILAHYFPNAKLVSDGETR